jgi:hypothetical protein
VLVVGWIREYHFGRGNADTPSDARRPSSAQYSLCRGNCAWTEFSTWSLQIPQSDARRRFRWMSRAPPDKQTIKLCFWCIRSTSNMLIRRCSRMSPSTSTASLALRQRTAPAIGVLVRPALPRALRIATGHPSLCGQTVMFHHSGKSTAQSIRSRHSGMARCGACHHTGHRPDPLAHPGMTRPTSAAKTKRPVNAPRWCGVNNYFPLMAWFYSWMSDHA